MFREIISKSVAEAINSLWGATVAPSSISVQKTRKDFRGDFTVVVFPLLKFSKTSPEATAQAVGDFLLSHSKEVISFNVIKGFLNIELHDSCWQQLLNIDDLKAFVRKNHPVAPQRFVLEYSSPNTNKPLHLGHIRNNLLGHSVAEILDYYGHKVYRVNLVNDRGIHICKSMLAWQKWGKGATPETENIKGDHFVGKYYVLFERAYRTQIKELVEAGHSEDDAKKKAPLIKEAQNMLKLWEQDDPQVKELWQKMNTWVLQGFDRTYEKLGISFDKTYFESATYLYGKKLVEEGLREGVFYQKNDKSVWVDLQDEKLEEKLLLRSDGTSVYITQDIGTAQIRYNDYNADNFVYVVGNEQNYHFDVLKAVLKKLGKPWADGLYHLSYGMVELPEGKMKSREGKVVDADDLIDEMLNTAQKHTEELGKTELLSSDEAQKLFYKLAMGALKYFILKVDPKKNMVFNPEESIDFNGNTGPFIQYSYVRICSLKQKAQEKFADTDYSLNKETALHEKEKSLLRAVHEYPDIINEAAQSLSPAVLANYLYELAKEYNQFYHELPVLKEKEKAKALLRLSISDMCGRILKQGMKLLGVEMPEKM